MVEKLYSLCYNEDTMEKAYKLEFLGEKEEGLSVSCCGISRTEPLHSFGPAIKPYYIIHYVLRGKGIFSLGGETYPLEAGYGFLITPQELAFYQADEKEPWSYVWVGFSGTNASKVLSSLGLTVQNPLFKSEHADELYAAVKDMMKHNTYGIANDLRRNGQLNLFLSLVADSQPVSENNETDKGDQYVKKAMEFIRVNYCNPIKITDVAEYVCINRSYLYTLFNKAIKMSPQQFLTAIRLTKATELLQLTSISVESIAISCGYVDPLVFSKAFKLRYQMSPSAYRKELIKQDSKQNMEDLKLVEEFLGNKN